MLRLVGVLVMIASNLFAAEPPFTRQEDMVYGRKDGMARLADWFDKRLKK